MSLETQFSVVNLLVLPTWFLIIFCPDWKGTRSLLQSTWLMLPLPLIYMALVVPHLADILPALSQPTLQQITSMLGKPESALVAWIHFLAFDLFVGRWIYLDSQSRSIHKVLVGIILFFTFMLGPIGLASYLIWINTWARKTETNTPGIKTIPESRVDPVNLD